jgi:hypothetical protein
MPRWRWKRWWLAATLLDVELRLRRVRRYRALPQAREALQRQRRRAGDEQRKAVAG